MPNSLTDHYNTLKKWAKSIRDIAILDFLATSDKEYTVARLREVGEELGISDAAVRCTVQRIRARAALQGYAPEHGLTKTVPETHYVKGVSTLYGKDGAIKQQWVKSDARADQLRELAEELADALKQDLPQIVVPKTETVWQRDINVVLPMGDPHIGLHSWGEETGEDFDLKIAERDLCAAVDRLVLSTPPAVECLIANLGDFFHADNMNAETMRSKHKLDVDTRWAKVLRVGVKIMRYAIESAAKRHKHVTVINSVGNHDDHSSIFLSTALGHIFENDPRITVNLSPAKVHYHTFGKCFYAITHGDTIKMRDLASVAASERPEEWGRTKYRYGLTGHIHHDSRIELRGMVVESFRTLAARDAYAASHGYSSGRDMKALVHHREFGEIGRHTVNIGMIQAETNNEE